MITKGTCAAVYLKSDDMSITTMDGHGSIAHVHLRKTKTNNTEERKDNANLIAEAFNTYNKTGLTPSQLAEQREELLEACKLAFRGLLKPHERGKYPSVWENITPTDKTPTKNGIGEQLREAIAKAEGGE